jgi:hypothetical protein
MTGRMAGKEGATKSKGKDSMPAATALVDDCLLQPKEII